MYQKLLLFLMIALFLFGAAGCQRDEYFTSGNNETQENAIHNETTQESTTRNETVQENVNHSETSETIDDEQEVLALEDYRNNPVSHNFEEDSLLNTVNIDLPHTSLDERNESFYNNEEEFDVLVQYIRDALHVEINDRWKVFVHYYDTDKTVGMVQFIYTIGEINTNRSILFNISGSKYDTLYYKCLTGDIDEADLSTRINLFKSKYIQGKRELQEGESFYKEQTSFTYYIHSDILMYSYAYFFQYDIGVINNDWGTERIIDKNGNAAAIT